jgi:hypothetical protein
MPLDKLKKLISFKETDPDKEEEEKQRSGRDAVPERHKQSAACHLEIGPKLLMTPSL